MQKGLRLPLGNPKKSLDALMGALYNILWFFGKHAFLVFLVITLINISFGAFLFYRYIFLINVKELAIPSAPIEFRENTYQSVLQEWQTRENIFKESSQKIYQDPFELYE